MKHITFWLVLMFIAVGIQFVGRMSPKAKAAKKIEPASVSKIEGSDLKRLTLLPEAAKRLDIQTAEVKRGDVRRVVATSGTVSALVTVDIGSQLSGNIGAVNVDYSTEVKQGEVLARIERNDRQRRVHERAEPRSERPL